MDNNDIINFSKIKNLINQNDVLVDVGACLGDYTNFFSDIIGDTGKIYTIELHPTTAETLRNRFLNKSNILIINNAVSDKKEMVSYYAGHDSHTNNIMGHDMEFRPYNKIGDVESTTLDDILVNEEKIKMIKIDVEGAEKLVLKGMDETIKKVEYLLVECHLNEDWGEIRDVLLNKFKLSCKNNITDSEITIESPRPYQCFCKKN
jgi:FkbM family methyltransferase